jgi:hypothetical protein
MDYEKYSKMYKENNIVTVPDFVSHSSLEMVCSLLKSYVWWKYSVVSDLESKDVTLYNLHDKNLETRFLECNQSLKEKKFTYRFSRTINDHFGTCSCIWCRLRDTVSNQPFHHAICKIIGCNRLETKEIFVSRFVKDDFLSIHNDDSKGDIAVTISFSEDWDPTYGGILHFLDEEKNINKSIVPKLGSMNIFSIREGKTQHFVSPVTVDKERFTLSVWYNIFF